MSVHEFEKSLAKSEAQANAPWWEEVYREAFPSFASMVCVRADGWAQRGGIDRVITLASGKTLTVDEKVRAADWPDVLLEYWSSVEHRRPGWVAKDLACDFVAYAFVPSRTCLLLPFHALRRAWESNGEDWVKRYKRVEAKNPGYTTVSVAVPTSHLMRAMQDAMVINWQAPKVKEALPPRPPLDLPTRPPMTMSPRTPGAGQGGAT